MGSYPALAIKPPEIDDPIQKALSLRSLMQGQQLHQQQIQENEVKLKQQQQDQQDRQTVMQALGQTQGDVGKALPMLAGKVSPQALEGLQKFDVEHKESLLKQTKEENELAEARSSKLAALTQQAAQLPPDQYQQNWPQIASQALQIEPKLQGHVDPSQPLPQDQLGNLQLGFVTQAQYHAQAVATQQANEEQRKAAEEQRKAALAPSQLASAQAEAQLKQQEVAAGGPPQLADSRYRTIAEKQRLGKPLSAEEQAFQQAYVDQKKASQPFGAARIEIARENADRKDTDYIDKNYVKPANDAEKSYQMFIEAYNNRNNAKTGAESMLALSTHLATTFGNVKGSRVTKDMIQEHLGARGITDSALVAVQKLTNGDALSPDQWDAFKSLISNSRRLSWSTADKEAKRRGVDISGSMPNDLGGKGDSATSNDPFAAFGGARKP